MKTTRLVLVIVMLIVVIIIGFVIYLALNQPISIINTNNTNGNTTSVENKTFTLDDNNQTLNLNVGESFLLKLGEFYDWDVTLSDENIVNRQVNITVVRGAQGVYQARAAGTTQLSAIGDPKCRKVQPACAAPSILFKLIIAVDAQANWQTYNNDVYGLSIRYPREFELKTGQEANYAGQYFNNQPGENIIQIYIPQTYQPQTNFSEASLNIDVAKEQLNQEQCFQILGEQPTGAQKQINGVSFTEFSGTNAAAGNIYQLTSYRTIYNNKCYSLDLVVHSGNFANYDSSLGIKEFDYDKVNLLLNEILQTFRFTK